MSVPKTIDKFIELANKLDEDKTDVCFQDFLDRISYCKDMDELAEYFSNFELYGYDSTCGKTKEGHYAGVNLITIHSAKGLEWDTTYLSLTNFDRKQYHKDPSGRYSKEINEKRRLWFVGATRAKEKLICTGQYVIPNLTNKDGIITNDFLKKAYDYNTIEYLVARNDENEKKIKQNEAAVKSDKEDKSIEIER